MYGLSIGYSGTSIIWTRLGPHQTILIIEVSLVQRLVHNTAVMLLYLVDTIKYSTYKQDIRVKVNFVYDNVYTIITLIILGYHISSSYRIVYNNGKQQFLLPAFHHFLVPRCLCKRDNPEQTMALRDIQYQESQQLVD